MHPVREVLPSVLASIVREAPLTPEKVTFAWRDAVGRAVAQATTVELRGSVLHVRARDEAWRREVERAAAMIRPRLERLLGERVVRFIKVE